MASDPHSQQRNLPNHALRFGVCLQHLLPRSIVSRTLLFSGVVIIPALMVLVGISMIWSVTPQADATRANLELALLIVSGSLLVLLVFAAAGVSVLVRQLTSRIQALKAGSEAVSRGDFAVRVKPSGPREFAELTEAFNHMLEEIEAREQRRKDDIHTISHDLRSPLTVMAGHAQLIERTVDNPERVLRSAKAIGIGAQRMNAMIQDLVDSARLESGQLQLHPQVLDLGDYLTDLNERLSGLVDGGRVKLKIAAEPMVARVDPDRFERALMNLINNALKYSDPSTEVVLQISRDGDVIRVLVSDDGPGIPPEELPRLFQRFHRVQHIGQDQEGLGLGLYIARKLVEAHGGAVEAESAVGKGSIFKVTLPAVSL